MFTRRTALAGAAALAITAAAAPALAQTRLNPNTATAAQLGAVVGVTPALASAIVAGRPYASAVEFNAKLRETLSEEQAKAVLVNVFVPWNLNSGSREAVALIPGMTPRMIREFFEYRPYTGLDEFNREIGKYVPPEEVARFRSYVTM